MESRKEILAELKEIAPFLGREGIPRVPFAVPGRYFEAFAELLMNRIRFEAEISSAQEGTEISPFREISEISPILAGLQRKNTYHVPDGFFEALKVDIPTKNIPFIPVGIPPLPVLKNTDARKKHILSLPVRMIRYAAAACIIGLIGTASFNMFFHRVTTDPITGLTTMSDQDMTSYLESDDIHWAPDNTSTSETASMDFSDNDIHELLDAVPDAELEQYVTGLPDQKRNVN